MRPVLTLLFTTLIAGTAAANDQAVDAEAAAPCQGPTGYIGAGVVTLPKYVGSDDRLVLPLVLGRIAYKGMSAELIGPGARFDLLPLEGWSLGPTVNFRFPRKVDDANDPLSRLPEIGTAIELGVLAGKDFFFDYGRTGFSVEVEARADVAGVHKSSLGIVGVRGYRVLGAGFTLSLDTALVYFGGGLSRTYFGVSAEAAAASGIAEHAVKAGIGEADFGVSLSYDLAQSWRLVGRAQVNQLLGDAKDSPVVGNATGTLFGLGVAYAF